MNTPLPPASVPSAVEPRAQAPAWITVSDLDDVLDAVEYAWGNEARQALELRWDDLDDVLESTEPDRRIRIWAEEGRLESAAVGHDPAAESPLAHSDDEDPVSRTQADRLGRFIRLTSEKQANDALKAYGQQLYFWVDTYEHGGVDYAVSGTRYSSSFDVSSGNALFVPDSDTQAAYKRLRKTMAPLEARRTFVDAANRTLARFTAWANGEVHTVEVRAFDRQGHPLGQDRLYDVQGMDEIDHAIDTLADTLRNTPLLQPVPVVESPVTTARRRTPDGR